MRTIIFLSGWRTKGSLRPRPFAELAAELSACHAINSDEDERDAQDLPHIDEHGGLPGFLHFLGVFDEEAGREDACQAEAEVEARAHLLRPLVVEHVADDEEQKIADSLVELPRMARQHVHPFEDESPGHVGGFADNLRVHQVAQPDEHGTGGRGDGHVVQYAHDVHLRLSHVKPQGEHQPDGAPVAGQPRVSREMPAVRRLTEGENHFQRVGEEVARFIEEAMPQARAHQDAHEAVKEQGVEELVGDVLLLVEPPDQHIGGQQGEAPAQRIPAYAEAADVEGEQVRVPQDVLQLRHHGFTR